MRLLQTPSQTVGPFFHIGLAREDESRLVPDDHPEAVRIAGAITDGDGELVRDALVEIWQANSAGRYAHPDDHREELPLEDAFTGFGRCPTDDHGCFEFVTVKPGRVPTAGGELQAPHINVGVFARGLLKRLVTRIYFPDDEQANAADPVLSSIEQGRRSSLVARRDESGLRFDIYLQGERETVFFDV